MVPSIALTPALPPRWPLLAASPLSRNPAPLCTSVLDWASAAGFGFSHFVSVGNMLDVGIDDLLDYLAADPLTDAVVLYVESITEAREFMSAARAFRATNRSWPTKPAAFPIPPGRRIAYRRDGRRRCRL